MITHNSFKLIMDEKNREIKELKTNNSRLEYELNSRKNGIKKLLKDIFGIDNVACCFCKGNGIIEIRDTTDKVFKFQLSLILSEVE